jgi:adenine-specific DNA-methyltransferase
MATNQAFNSEEMQVPVLEMEGHGYLGESTALHVWLIYEPDLEFLKSPSAALTLAKAQAMAELKPEKRHLVFAPARFVSQRMLDESGVHLEFAPLPFGLYRMELG